MCFHQDTLYGDVLNCHLGTLSRESIKGSVEYYTIEKAAFKIWSGGAIISEYAKLMHEGTYDIV